MGEYLDEEPCGKTNDTGNGKTGHLGGSAGGVGSLGSGRAGSTEDGRDETADGCAGMG